MAGTKRLVAVRGACRPVDDVGADAADDGRRRGGARVAAVQLLPGIPPARHHPLPSHRGGLAASLISFYVRVPCLDRSWGWLD